MRGTRGATRSRGQRLLYPPPSLDLRFAETRSLTDWISGQNLITFSRASSATFVGSNGVLQTAVTNLLLRSEEFDNASWTKDGISVSSNSLAAPNGQLTADTLVENSLNAAHFVQSSAITAASGVAHTFSVYAKAGTRSRLELLGFALSLTGRGFDLSNGTTFANTAGLGEPSSFSIQPVGDGWYRCSITANGNGLISTVRAYLNNGTSYAYTGDGTSGLHLWGAQLEQSSTVGEYVPTTSTINSAPRFDHNPTTGESLGLLVEEARTNLLLRSEEFDNASWTKTRSSVTGNAIAAPNGALTADQLIEDGSASTTHFVTITATVTTGTYTHSVYAKPSGRNHIALQGFNGASNPTAYFNIATGVVGTTFDVASTAITPAGNGWYRCSITYAVNSGTATTAAVYLANANNSPTYTGDGTSGIYIWGAQLEAGAFPTSYIPTTTATATRSADVASITGSNFSSWYRQDEGTFFADARSIGSAGSERFPLIVQGSTFDDRWVVGVASINQYQTFYALGGAAQANLTTGSLTDSSGFRIASVSKANDIAMVVNGGAALTDSSASLITANQLGIGKAAQYLNGTIRRLTYWPQRLPNNTLIALTR